MRTSLSSQRVSQRARRFVACGAPLLFALGCGGDSASSPHDDVPPAELVLGTGEAAFEPAQSGDTLTLFAGTQGGHHVWLSMRERGFDPDSLRMILDVVPEPPLPPAHTDVQLHFTARMDASDDGLPYEFAGWPARVLMPECAVGTSVLLRVSLVDDQGHEAKQELTVVVGAPRFPFSHECEP